LLIQIAQRAVDREQVRGGFDQFVDEAAKHGVSVVDARKLVAEVAVLAKTGKSRSNFALGA
jgi:hypothetical protein